MPFVGSVLGLKLTLHDFSNKFHPMVRLCADSVFCTCSDFNTDVDTVEMYLSSCGSRHLFKHWHMLNSDKTVEVKNYLSVSLKWWSKIFVVKMWIINGSVMKGDI